MNSRRRNSGKLKEEQDDAAEPMLKEIREDFARDGQKWYSSHENNLVSLWKKYKRTDDHLKKTIKDFDMHKQKTTKEFEELKKYVNTNKELHQKRDDHLKQVMEENSKLMKQKKQNDMEREAYLKEHQAFIDLLNTECSNQAWNATNASAVKKLEDLIDEKKNMLEQIREQSELVDELQQERQVLNQSNEALTDTIKTMSDQQSGENKNLQEKLESSSLENSALKDIKETLSKEVDKLSLELEKQEKVVDTVKNQLEAAKVSITEHKSTNDALRKTITAVENDSRTLIEKIKKENDTKTELKSRCTRLEQELATKCEEFQNCLQEKHQILEQNKALKESMTELNRQLSIQDNAQVISLKKEIEEKKQQNESLESLLREKSKTLTDQESMYQNQLKASQEMQSSSEEEIKMLAQKNIQLKMSCQTTLDQLTKNIEITSSRMSENMHKINLQMLDLEKRLIHVVNQHGLLQIHVVSLSEQQHEDSVEELQKKCSDFERKLSFVEESANETQIKLVAENEILKSSLSESVSGQQVLTRENTKLSAKMNANEEMIKSIKQKSSENKAVLESELKALRSQFEDTNNQLQSMTVKLESLEAEKKHIETTLTAMNETLASTQKDAQEQVDFYKQSNEKFKAEIDESNKQIMEVKMSNENLAKQLATHQAKAKDTAQTDQKKHDEVCAMLEAKLKEKTTELQDQSHAHQNAMKKLSTKLEAEMTHKSRLEREIQEKLMLINEIEAKNKSLEENQAIMQDEMERLKEKLSETIKEYEIKKKINESEERKEILSLNSQIMHQKGVELSQLTQKQIKLEEALEERATLLNDLTSRMKDTTIRKKQLQNEVRLNHIECGLFSNQN
jgi:chromosome segregation protein